MQAKAVANFMLYIMSDAFDDLTNMKINEMLYFAQGHYLNMYGETLFDDEIEAWEHGPVIPSVHDLYRVFGDRPINAYDGSILTDITTEAEEVLFGVARKYGKYTLSALQNMTRIVGSPWDQVYEENRAHVEIPISIMRDYFSTVDALQPATKQFRESDFIGYRDSDGIFVLPKEWDD